MNINSTRDGLHPDASMTLWNAGVMRYWPWIASGVALISSGLVLWYTTFVAIPAGVILITIGLVKVVRRRHGSESR
jgi:hypothetical protein